MQEFSMQNFKENFKHQQHSFQNPVFSLLASVSSS